MQKRYKTVYVICPALFKTGGTEVLHQLVKEINDLGGNAVIAYFLWGDLDGSTVCNPAFYPYTDGKYVMKDEIIDAEENAVIVPENFPQLLTEFDHAKLFLWWLSVDNFPTQGLPPEDVAVYFQFMKVRNVFHLVQSAYAEDYIRRTGGVEETVVRHLGDYLNSCYTDEPLGREEREDIVVYNPRKGKEYLQTLLEEAVGMDFVPIQNMSNDEVRALLQRAKVYIDFGHHPGKDRIPREAAMCGCCVITGRRGSAAFAEDVSIPEEYRLDERNTELSCVVEKIVQCMMEYPERTKDFDAYRRKIQGERQEFTEDVKAVFLQE